MKAFKEFLESVLSQTTPLQIYRDPFLLEFYENCKKLREVRKIAIFVRFVAKWILAKFVAEKDQRGRRILNETAKITRIAKSQFS